MDFILDALFKLLEALVTLLPEWTPPAELTPVPLFQLVFKVNEYVPIDTMFICWLIYAGICAVAVTVGPILRFMGVGR